MREKFIFAMLLIVKGFSRLFYRVDLAWIEAAPRDPWSDLRLVVFLNHTSLYEPLFVGGFPNRFLKKIACQGLMPVADKAIRRPVMGYFFRMVAKNVVQVTRKRDNSWLLVLESLKPDSMVIIMPEGRMKRATGLDNQGKPMTVLGGVADVIQAIPDGKMLITLSAGLHHVQIPGQWIPRIFKTLRMRLQQVDIAGYRRALLATNGYDGFKKAVIRDLEDRRDRYCVN
ncbi:MAG: hypothetical protein AB7S77_19035 [Desulfatirhabdiaceae bacterium]